MKYYIGIDPGKKGAIAVMREGPGGFEFSFYPSDSLQNLCQSLREVAALEGSKFCRIEKVHAMPKQGVTSSFNFGVSFGQAIGILHVLQVPYELVTPQAWQKGLLFKADGATPKARALAAAERLFPGVVFRGPKGGVLDGKVDAALIAYSCRTGKG